MLLFLSQCTTFAGRRHRRRPNQPASSSNLNKQTQLTPQQEVAQDHNKIIFKPSNPQSTLIFQQVKDIAQALSGADFYSSLPSYDHRNTITFNLMRAFFRRGGTQESEQNHMYTFTLPESFERIFWDGNTVQTVSFGGICTWAPANYSSQLRTSNPSN